MQWKFMQIRYQRVSHYVTVTVNKLNIMWKSYKMPSFLEYVNSYIKQIVNIEHTNYDDTKLIFIFIIDSHFTLMQNGRVS